jgi:hypothetical protein
LGKARNLDNSQLEAKVSPLSSDCFSITSLQAMHTRSTARPVFYFRLHKATRNKVCTVFKQRRIFFKYNAFGKSLCTCATVCRFVCQYRSTLNGIKTAITACIRNISQAELQKVFGNKIKRVQACINAREHHFQHLS